jgi:hypothetical protein
MDATTGVKAGGRRLELDLFSHIQGVVHLNPEISDGAFQLGMTEKKLDCTQVTGLAINALVARLQLNSSTAPRFRTELVDRSSFGQ